MLNVSAARDLADAFVRKKIGRDRIIPKSILWGENEGEFNFNYYYRGWRDLRKKGFPFGIRVAVAKENGKARHNCSLDGRTGTAMPDQKAESGPRD